MKEKRIKIKEIKEKKKKKTSKERKIAILVLIFNTPRDLDLFILEIRLLILISLEEIFLGLTPRPVPTRPAQVLKMSTYVAGPSLITSKIKIQIITIFKLNQNKDTIIINKIIII